jgi:hypothetical protein
MSPRVHFRIPAVRRALKVARDQNLNVVGFHIGADGSIHVEVAAGGSIPICAISGNALAAIRAMPDRTRKRPA